MRTSRSLLRSRTLSGFPAGLSSEGLIAGESDPEALAARADRRIKAPPAALREALRGRVTHHHRFLLPLHLPQIDARDAAIDGSIGR